MAFPNLLRREADTTSWRLARLDERILPVVAGGEVVERPGSRRTHRSSHRLGLCPMSDQFQAWAASILLTSLQVPGF